MFGAVSNTIGDTYDWIKNTFGTIKVTDDKGTITLEEGQLNVELDVGSGTTIDMNTGQGGGLYVKSGQNANKQTATISEPVQAGFGGATGILILGVIAWMVFK